jgi:leader peptidase (prepilin peptidase)/N-methyltransferase
MDGELGRWPAALILFAFGLMIGSFLNVCISRLPHGESVVSPRSRCPKCRTQIAWFDNIPLLSWIILRGKCRHCGAPISAQYPAIEAGVGLIWAASALHYGLTLRAIAGGLFGAILLGAVIMDFRHEIIPEQYSLAGMVLGVASWLGAGVSGLLTGVVGAAVGFILLFVVEQLGDHFFGEGAIGGAYSRMMVIVGAFLGWPGAVLVVLGAALFGGVVNGIVAPLKHRIIPFGVFVGVAAASMFVVGESISRWYMNFLRAGWG